jgi:hypothetical protein
VVVNLARGMAVAGDGTDSPGYLELVIGSAADDILKGGKRAIDSGPLQCYIRSTLDFN